MKPEAKIYRIACGRLDSVPERSLFVDDEVEYVMGAQDIGLTGALLDPTDTPQDEWVGETIKTLAGVRRLVR